jgi:hypothetical protein
MMAPTPDQPAAVDRDFLMNRASLHQGHCGARLYGGQAMLAVGRLGAAGDGRVIQM